MEAEKTVQGTCDKEERRWGQVRFREKSLKKSSVWRWRRFEHIVDCRPVATDDGGIEETGENRDNP